MQKHIDFKRIKQGRVIQLIREHKAQVVDDFLPLTSLCYDSSYHPSYSHHIKNFLVEDDLLRVWQQYKSISPQQAWNGAMLSFGVLYSKKRNELIYAGDTYPGLEEGQIIFINIQLLAGLFNIAVAHHITEVNEEEKTIKICYLEKGASEGSQWIRFLKTADGFTEIIHETYYKSKSKFRDTNLYPLLHERAITQFHKNVRLSMPIPLQPA